MQKTKRKTQPERLSKKLIAILLLVMMAFAGFTAYQYVRGDSNLRVIDLQLPLATVRETDDIQLMQIPEIEDRIRDVAFSEDRSAWYALGDSHLYQVALQGNTSELQAILALPVEYEAYTLAIYPGANQLAIGTMQTVDDIYKSAAILFVDMENLDLIDTVFDSNSSYNLGYSIELAFTPDGTGLYHLYNLNNAGCGRTSNHLEIWDMTTHQLEVYSLPTNFVSDFMLTDDMLALQINTDCSPTLSEGSRLTFFAEDGQEVSFPSGGTTGYQDLTVSDDGTLFAGVLAYSATNSRSDIHIWANDEMYTQSDDIQVNGLVKSIALSPDNRYLVLSVIPDNAGVLHFINLQTGRIDNSIQIGATRVTPHIQFSPDGDYLSVNAQDFHAIWYLP